MKKITMTMIAALLLCSCTSGQPAQTQGTPAPETTAEVTETTAETAAETTAGTAESTTEAAPGTTDIETTDTTAESETEVLAPVSDGGYAAAYKAKLQAEIDGHKNDDLSTYMFSLYDVGGDATPELFISSGDYHAASAEVFAYIDGSVESVGYVGSYGEAIYMTDRKQFDNANGGMGSFMNSIAEFDGNKITYGLTIEAYEGPDYDAEEPDYDDMIEKMKKRSLRKSTTRHTTKTSAAHTSPSAGASISTSTA